MFTVHMSALDPWPWVIELPACPIRRIHFSPPKRDSFLLLVVMPFATSSDALVTSSILATSSHALVAKAGVHRSELYR